MKKINRKAMYFLILAIVLLNSCKSKTAEDIGQKIDTLSTKVGKEIDTLANKIAGSNDSTFDKVKVTEMDTTGKAPDKVRARMNGVLSDYIDIKNALSNNDSSKAVNEANQLIASIEAVKDTSLTEKMRTGWKTSTAKVSKAASDIASAKTLDMQRRAFSQLSDALVTMIKTYGLNGRTVYIMQCTDSKNKMKEIWLVNSKDNDNPYAGGKASDAKNNKSANCSEVKEAWKFN